MITQLFILLLLLLAVVVLAASWWATARRPGLASRRRNQRAAWGEELAEEILLEAGFTILDRQVARSWTVFIDGEPLRMSVRADILAERDGRRFIVEVKTGEKAPDPSYPPTRRQLLEYAHVFQDHDLLLLDAETEQFVKVEFPARLAV